MYTVHEAEARAWRGGGDAMLAAPVSAITRLPMRERHWPTVLLILCAPGSGSSRGEHTTAATSEKRTASNNGGACRRNRAAWRQPA
jgi:hypothetical protein